MAFVREQTWQVAGHPATRPMAISRRSAVRVGSTYRSQRSFPFGRAPAILATLGIHFLFLWLVFTKLFHGTLPAAIAGGHGSLMVFNLSADDSSGGSASASAPEAEPEQPPPPTDQQSEVVEPQSAVKTSSAGATSNSGSSGATATGSGSGGGPDPFAGAAPLASGGSSYAGAAATGNQASGDALNLDAAALAAALNSIPGIKSLSHMNIELLVSITAEGVVDDVKFLRGEASADTISALIGALSGKKLYRNNGPTVGLQWRLLKLP